MDRDALQKAFAGQFGHGCSVIARGPGRVNLIGEHTDYNQGLVLPIACEQSTWVACRRRDDVRVCVVSESIAERYEWIAGRWNADDAPHWSSYVAGVAELLGERGANVGGFDMLITSNVPVGGGLSSSAALEVAAAKALARLAEHAIDDRELVDLCRQAEHEYAGVPCGVMDQSIAVFGRAGAALLLDCRTGRHEYVPLPLGDHAIVVIDSRVRHELAQSQYGKRQRQCARAVRFFQSLDSAVSALRDISPELLQSHAARMDPIAAARARHVTTENRRVLDAAQACKQGDLARLGPLLAESHRSLRDDYQVSCRELDQLVAICRDAAGVVAARMTGGGFGGCVLAIVQRDAIAGLAARINSNYTGPDGLKARVIATRAADGASLELG